MNILNIENLSKSYADKLIFENINLGIHENDKIGIIGQNGEGKTTLLKIIAGLEYEDSGKITKSRDLKIEYLPQNPIFNENNTILEQVFQSENESIQLVREYEEAIQREDTERILKISNRMDEINAWEIESEAKTILTQLGIKNFDRKIGTLSGGQKRRIALATALVNPSDLLILDEPTNHLDNKTIEWLEEYLNNKKEAVLMVTHDRYFLDRIVNKIVELDNKNLFTYEGNYNYFLEKKAQREDIQRNMERRRKSLYKQELAWMNQGIRARGTRQKARVERFEELKNSDFNIKSEEVDISLAGKRLGRKILELNNISKSYGNKTIIEGFSYMFLRDDRIGILGDNGAGKSTLMNIISGVIKPDMGSVDIGDTVKIGYFSQEPQKMEDSQRAIDYIKEGGEYIKTEDGDRITASQMMERFLFSGKEQYTELKSLSGGEKRRLYLLKILMEGPNFLILDEPTNDLDIRTLTVLEEYLLEFNGPVLVVSHDRYFLDKVVDKIFYVNRGKVKGYTGNYTSFKEKRRIEKSEENIRNINTKEIVNKSIKKTSKKPIKFTYNEQREWSLIDDEIEDLEKKLKNIEIKMKEVSTNYKKLEELLEEKEKIEEELNYKLDRWVYLSELQEEIRKNNKKE